MPDRTTLTATDTKAMQIEEGIRETKRLLTEAGRDVEKVEAGELPSHMVRGTIERAWIKTDYARKLGGDAARLMPNTRAARESEQGRELTALFRERHRIRDRIEELRPDQSTDLRAGK